MSDPISNEHNFWLRILSDHLDFIYDALCPEETQYINLADQLSNDLASIRNSYDPREILNLVSQIKEFKTKLLQDKVENAVKINLPPTFISHMLNELEEYVKILTHLIQNGTLPPVNLLQFHKLWLLDIIGHLDTIKSNLDPVEKLLKEKAHDIKCTFKPLFNKTLEFIDYFKHGIESLPALGELSNTSYNETVVYLSFIQELNNLLQVKRALGTITHQMLNHMFLEQNYYIGKLNNISE